jgi:hypothetical protein
MRACRGSFNAIETTFIAFNEGSGVFYNTNHNTNCAILLSMREDLGGFNDNIAKFATATW